MNYKKREKLIEFRKKEKKTQEEMAVELNLSTAMYKSLENGYKNPSYCTLKKFAEVFKIKNIYEIFF